MKKTIHDDPIPRPLKQSWNWRLVAKLSSTRASANRRYRIEQKTPKLYSSMRYDRPQQKFSLCVFDAPRNTIPKRTELPPLEELQANYQQLQPDQSRSFNNNYHSHNHYQNKSNRNRHHRNQDGYDEFLWNDSQTKAEIESFDRSWDIGCSNRVSDYILQTNNRQ